jgi:gluconate 2-dehydrogenase alpha chain
MMARRLQPADVVLVGVGWTGGILARELTRANVRVVGLERGAPRVSREFAVPHSHDELRYALRYELAQDLSRETVTFRHDTRGVARPMRAYGSFMPGEGVGGAGVHWNGTTWRFLPYDFEMRSRTIARYGAKAIPRDAFIQDWGVTYDELEPYFDQFEYVCGISGKAGNIKGEIQPGGNPFEGPRRREYPTPPLAPTYSAHLFAEAAGKLGYHPFPRPSANLSEPYTTPDGQRLGRCVYCGYCERFGCEMNAKSSPHLTVIPAALSTGRFDLRPHANVLRINLDSAKRRAVSVTYLDLRTGEELEQPASLVCLTSYTFNNVRLMLLSKIGRPYDPASGRGVVGRSYTYQGAASASLFFDDKVFNTFMGTGSVGQVIDDFNGDNFDHAGLGFLHGGSISVGNSGARPIAYHPTPPGTPRWGSAWKQTAARYYNRSFGIGAQNACLSYRQNYLDLDPQYTDAFGQPLLRMTFDWGDNERQASEYMASVCERIGKSLNPSHLAAGRLGRVGTPGSRYSIVPYQSTHNCGGAIMGSDPSTSAVNKFLQSWDVPNVFVVGASAFAHNSGYNPTGTVGALAYWAAHALVSRYLARPGRLVS